MSTSHNSAALTLLVYYFALTFAMAAATTDKSIQSRKIFVYTFPSVPHVVSISPFALKLESYMRINKIAYEPIYGMKFSSKGMIPYVRLDNSDDGEEIADSNVVLARLKAEQAENADTDAHLTPEQKAMTHSLTRMLEEHTAQIGFYYRYGLHMPEFVEALEIEDRFGTESVKRWLPNQPDLTKTKMKMRGLTRHSDDELWQFCNDDLQAVSDYLGDKPYMFGNTPSTADCVVFGHVSQLLWIPIDFPMQTYLKEKCPNVVDFMHRFREEFWPDWDELCAPRK
jgi:glutathione S-transferase